MHGQQLLDNKLEYFIDKIGITSHRFNGETIERYLERQRNKLSTEEFSEFEKLIRNNWRDPEDHELFFVGFG